MSSHPKGNKEDEGSRPQATADITKTSTRCQAHRTPQGQRKLGKNPTAEEPRVANVSEPIWKPGMQTGRSGVIQAGTVLSGEHRRQTGSDQTKGGYLMVRNRETSKTRDPGYRQLRISSRLDPAVRCREHRRDRACQDRTIRRKSRGRPMDLNHYRNCMGDRAKWSETGMEPHTPYRRDKRGTGHEHTMSSYPVVGIPWEDRKGHMQRLPSTRRVTAG